MTERINEPTKRLRDFPPGALVQLKGHTYPLLIHSVRDDGYITLNRNGEWLCIASPGHEIEASK